MVDTERVKDRVSEAESSHLIETEVYERSKPEPPNIMSGNSIGLE